jgi:arginine exporter protein ArgO
VALPSQNLVQIYASTVFLTLTNPATILAFGLVFAGLGLAAAEGDRATAIWLVLGVFSGSAAWWLLLSSGVSLLQTRLTQRHLRWLNRGSGIILIAFGSVALWPSSAG